MATAAMWDFHRLLDEGSLKRIVTLRAVMKDILRNPVLAEVLEDIEQGRIDIKAESHGGHVFVKTKCLDLGNYKYAFLFCSLARLSRNEKHDIEALFEILGKKYTTLAINAPYTDTMLWKKGDVIECILAKSLLTGAATDPDLKVPRHAMQQSFRDFDVAMDDVYRCIFRSWEGPPKARQMVNVADLSAMVLLAHSIHITAVPDSWYACFDDLASSARVPLREERLPKQLEVKDGIIH